MRATDGLSERQTVGESDVQERIGSITSVLQPGPHFAEALSPRDTSPWLDSQLLHQHCWLRASICSPDLLACADTHSHIQTHTGLKVMCIYLDTQARARQKFVLTIRRHPFRFCWCDEFEDGRMTAKTFRRENVASGTDELWLWIREKSLSTRVGKYSVTQQPFCLCYMYLMAQSAASPIKYLCFYKQWLCKVCSWRACTSHKSTLPNSLPKKIKK